MRVVISCAATGFNGLDREILRLRNARWDRRQTLEYRSRHYRRVPDAAERRDTPANLNRRTARRWSFVSIGLTPHAQRLRWSATFLFTRTTAVWVRCCCGHDQMSIRHFPHQTGVRDSYGKGLTRTDERRLGASWRPGSVCLRAWRHGTLRVLVATVGSQPASRVRSGEPRGFLVFEGSTLEQTCSIRLGFTGRRPDAVFQVGHSRGERAERGAAG